MPANFENKLIEVCSECSQASCYHGEFMCFESRTAGTELKTVRELRKLAHENPDNWSDENLNKIYGEPAPNGYKQIKAKPSMFWEWISWQIYVSFKGLDHMSYFTYLSQSNLKTKDIHPFRSLEADINAIMKEENDQFKKCKWVRAFDQHFNIGCVNNSGQRGNGNFKSCNDMSAKWEFVFCPYCGNEIELTYPEID